MNHVKPQSFFALILLPIILFIGCSSEGPSEKPRIFTRHLLNSEKKICVIDIGPLNREIFDELMSEGRLPHIKKLADRGLTIRLDRGGSRYLSDAAFYSEVFTGVRAGDNGIIAEWWGTESSPGYTFSNYQELIPPGLFELLPEKGVSSLFINCPLSHPAPKNGAVVISDRFLLCPDDAVYPLELGELLSDEGILPREEGIESRIKDLLASRTTIMKADVEALNRFINYPLSEKNFDDLVGDNLDPGPRHLEKSLRVLAWELRKDRAILEILTFLESNYPLPDIIMIRSGVLEQAQRFFMRYHYARGYNISPKEMERFGSIVERCYEYADEFLGQVMDILPSRRRTILISGCRMEPATAWTDSIINDPTIAARMYRGHPIGFRINPSNLANELNYALRTKKDVVLRPYRQWPLYPFAANDDGFMFELMPSNVESAKKREVIHLLTNCSDEHGGGLFDIVKAVGPDNEIIRLKVRNNIASTDLFDAEGVIISAGDFIEEYPQVSAFAAPGGMLIVYPYREFKDWDSKVKSPADVNELLLSIMGLQVNGYGNEVPDSDRRYPPYPHNRVCDKDLGYILNALGYIE